MEVDFLLARGSAFLAIGAKANPRPTRARSPGLSAIAELPGILRRILVYPGDRRLRLDDGAEVLPFGAFLEEIGSGDLFRGE